MDLIRGRSHRCAGSRPAGVRLARSPSEITTPSKRGQDDVDHVRVIQVNLSRRPGGANRGGLRERDQPQPADRPVTEMSDYPT